MRKRGWCSEQHPDCSSRCLKVTFPSTQYHCVPIRCAHGIDQDACGIAFAANDRGCIRIAAAEVPRFGITTSTSTSTSTRAPRPIRRRSAARRSGVDAGATARPLPGVRTDVAFQYGLHVRPYLRLWRRRRRFRNTPAFLEDDQQTP